tara:strand:+ start:103248 stop:103448 length:201 start_codon:yes stop_codon:yes gene_type:complete
MAPASGHRQDMMQTVFYLFLKITKRGLIDITCLHLLGFSNLGKHRALDGVIALIGNVVMTLEIREL